MVQGIFRYKTNIFKDHETSVLQYYEQNVMYGPVFEGGVNVALYDKEYSNIIMHQRVLIEIILKADCKKKIIWLHGGICSI